MTGSTESARIKEHMAVVGSDGVHVGTVDKVEDDRIKLTKSDNPDGGNKYHHYLPVSAVAAVEGDEVRLTMDADRARGLAMITGDQPAPGMGSMSGS